MPLQPHAATPSTSSVIQIVDVFLVQYIIGDHIEEMLAEQEDFKCKLWSFVSSFSGQKGLDGQTMMMLYKGHNRPRRPERPEVQPALLAGPGVFSTTPWSEQTSPA